MHAGGGASGTAHAQQRMSAYQVSVCQEFNDGEQWRIFFFKSSKTGTVEIDMDGEYQGVCEGAVGPRRVGSRRT